MEGAVAGVDEPAPADGREPPNVFDRRAGHGSRADRGSAGWSRHGAEADAHQSNLHQAGAGLRVFRSKKGVHLLAPAHVGAALSQYADDGRGSGQVSRNAAERQRGCRDARTPSSCRTWRSCPPRHASWSPRRKSCPCRALRRYSKSRDAPSVQSIPVHNATSFRLAVDAQVSDSQSGCDRALMPSRTPSLRRSACGSSK